MGRDIIEVMIRYRSNGTRQVLQEDPPQAMDRGLQQMVGKVTRPSVCALLNWRILSYGDVCFQTEMATVLLPFDVLNKC